MGSPLSELGRRAREAQDRALSSAQAPTSAARLLAQLHRRRRAVRLATAVAALVAALVVGVVGVVVRARPLSFAVAAGPEGRAGEWIAADPAREVPVQFSDGSRFALQPASQVRVASVTDDGARLVLERGAMDAAVVHRARTAWEVDAGPFAVHVTGTRFRLVWEPESQRLDVVMAEGSVRVTGPMLDGGRALRGGERLDVHLREKRLVIHTAEVEASQVGSSQVQPAQVGPPQVQPSEVRPSEVRPSQVQPSEVQPSEVRPSQVQPPQSQASEVRPSEVRPSQVQPPQGQASEVRPSQVQPSEVQPSGVQPPQVQAPQVAPTWRELASAGRYREALAAADASGFDALCTSVSASDLLALGDAARFAGNPGRARQAYLALRKRFPGGRDAAVAAFVLGRMRFDGDRAFADAARWFRTYLSEAPGGAHARDASGRLVEALQRSGDASGARAAAQRYLDAYPSGPHAALARSLVAP